jgi:hypothetical protein
MANKSDRFFEFKSSSSPVQVSINQACANPVEDWKRLNWESTIINGRKLSEIFEELGFARENIDKELLGRFFRDVILKDYTGDKDKASAVLFTSFHQGGLLHPVSAGMALVLKDQEFGAGASEKDNTKEVHIKTSAIGFTIQEIYTVKKCLPSVLASDDFNEKFPDGILPDDENDYVFQAQATMDVSFQDGNEAPIVNVKNNTINFGSNYVKNIADNRSWLYTFIDFLKNLFGTNKVENLAAPNEENTKLELKS